MRAGWWAVVALLASCGLETVPSLPAPNAVYSDLTLVTDTSLAFVHENSRYSGTDFRGYYVYYKVYARSDPPSDTFDRLLSDNSTLSGSPTEAKLRSLGYRRMTVSSSDDATVSDVDELFLQPADNDKITLDFEDFIQSDGKPRLELSGVLPTQSYLYRTMSSPDMSFDSLRTASVTSPLPEDMQSMTSAQVLDHDYEINVFVIAYGVTSNLTEVYSSPVPWGVLRPIQP